MIEKIALASERQKEPSNCWSWAKAVLNEPAILSSEEDKHLYSFIEANDRITCVLTLCDHNLDEYLSDNGLGKLVGDRDQSLTSSY